MRKLFVNNRRTRLMMIVKIKILNDELEYEADYPNLEVAELLVLEDVISEIEKDSPVYLNDGTDYPGIYIVDYIYTDDIQIVSIGRK